MTTTIEVHDVVVRQVLYQFQGFRVLTEEMLTGVGTAVVFVVLQLAVAHFVHALLQQAAVVVFQQRVPLAAPDDLEDIPTGAAEYPLELLDNLAVAAHRTIQTLQVAVDDEDEIAQAFTPGHGYGAERLRLIAFAVAEKTPDVAVAMIEQAPALLVFHDVGLINGLNRAQAHGHCGKLPVIRHQPGVRIRGQAVAIHLTPEVVQLLLGKPPFKVGARVHARRTVALVKHQVTGVTALVTAEEIVKAHIVKCGAGREG